MDHDDAIEPEASLHDGDRRPIDGRVMVHVEEAPGVPQDVAASLEAREAGPCPPIARRGV
jgi:hypothetical protein